MLCLDYDHDSDAEWGQEEEGSADDVDSQDESNEDDRSSVGSDMDDWLVEGDEIEVEPADITDDPMTVMTPPLLTDTNTKRKSVESKDPPKKKRKVVPLIPFQKGPVWERQIGECDYKPFKPMRIQLFNGTPFSVIYGCIYSPL